jgi:dienelactone hydrolase
MPKLKSRNQIRQALLAGLGRWPQRPARVALKVLARHESQGVQRLLLEYAVEPGERIRAWLLAPADVDLRYRTAKLAALLCPHPHGGQFQLGKDFTIGSPRVPRIFRQQCAYALRFAQQGYVCLTPDMLAFGERRPQGRAVATGPWQERIQAMRQLMLGRCMLTKFIHDLRVSLDVLCSFPAVDTARMGAVGFSMGSGSSWYTAMLEPRIRAVVGVCSFYTYQGLTSPKLVHCYMNYLPGVIGRGVEMADLFGLIAPRPFLMLTGVKDAGTPIADTRRLYRQARHWWQDCPARFRLSAYNCGHGFTDAMHAEAAAFLGKHLSSPCTPRCHSICLTLTRTLGCSRASAKCDFQFLVCHQFSLHRSAAAQLHQ